MTAHHRAARILLTAGLLLTAAFVRTGPVTAQDGAAAVPTVYVKKRAFPFPFQLDPGEPRPVQVQLWAQIDGGTEWKLQTQATPDQKAFAFRSDRDGTFDFAVRAYFADGSYRPAAVQQLRPSMRVVIDTLPPTVTLQPASRPGGMGVTWDVRDEYLDLASLKLEGRPVGKPDWAPLAAEAKATGEYVWQPRDETRYEIRLRVKDRAGNWGEASTVVAPPPAAGHAPAESPAEAPAKPAVRPNVFYLPHKRVSLEYRIARAGLSGVQAVDLWVCNADKKQWRLVPQATAEKPPVDGKATLVYEADKEGLYGFAMLARSGVGRQAPAPTDGTEPRVWVEVDTTKPKVEALEVRVGKGIDVRNLTILWKATDKNFGDAPIQLEYAEVKDGKIDPTWKEIGYNLPNTGKHTWTAPEQGPYRFVVRLRAVDRASNEGEKTSSEVIVDLVEPQVEITGVEPGRPNP